MTNHFIPLYKRFLNSASQYPSDIALDIDSHTLTYKDLKEKCLTVAATIQKQSNDSIIEFVGIFSSKSITAYTGILSAICAGKAYVPLNPQYPTERNLSIVQSINLKILIVDDKSKPKLRELLKHLSEPVTVYLLDSDDCSDWKQSYKTHSFISSKDLLSSANWVEPQVDKNTLAYILFTSGSTGKPKGVMVSNLNVSVFIESMLNDFGISISNTDRFSQFASLTFDQSIFDIFIPISCGARLCCPTDKDRIKPNRFIAGSNLTVIQLVPSLGLFMQKMSLLKPNTYPHLRWILVGGEALPASIAASLQDAAPNAIIDNVYGPTEMTVNSTAYRWITQKSDDECERGIVPIGFPLQTFQYAIVDNNLHEVSPGEKGELILSSPQMSAGYWNDPTRTDQSFIHWGDSNNKYYKTGDIVKQTHPTKPIHYINRKDFQVKVLGHRVELSEIETLIRQKDNNVTVAAVGWPVTSSGVTGIVVCLESCHVSINEIDSFLQAQLPDYMVPKQYYELLKMPLNNNGKIDRNKLVQLLENKEIIPSDKYKH